MSIQDTNFRADTGTCGSVVEAGRASVNAAQPYRNTFKRLIDLALVLAALPIVAPAVMVLALLVARDGSNPFYAQYRVGRGGKVFKMWKLRSMVPNAQSLLEDYLAENPAARREWDETQKLQNDPRITPFGHALRKTSLDELPQLWNVLMGEMSLVGPRPMLPEQQELYPGVAYFTLRPGMTGSWQVSKRNSSSFASRAEFDTSYADNLNFKTDLGILYSTVGVVVRATGI